MACCIVDRPDTSSGNIVDVPDTFSGMVVDATVALLLPFLTPTVAW